MRRPKRRPSQHPVRRLADAMDAVYWARTEEERAAAEDALETLRRELGLRTAPHPERPS